MDAQRRLIARWSCWSMYCAIGVDRKTPGAIRRRHNIVAMSATLSILHSSLRCNRSAAIGGNDRVARALSDLSRPLDQRAVAIVAGLASRQHIHRADRAVQPPLLKPCRFH